MKLRPAGSVTGISTESCSRKYFRTDEETPDQGNRAEVTLQRIPEINPERGRHQNTKFARLSPDTFFMPKISELKKCR